MKNNIWGFFGGFTLTTATKLWVTLQALSTYYFSNRISSIFLSAQSAFWEDLKYKIINTVILGLIGGGVGIIGKNICLWIGKWAKKKFLSFKKKKRVKKTK